MKMKSFAMLMVSGLLVASLVYVAPAMADDMNDNDTSQTMQPSAPSDNSSMGSGISQGSDSSTSNDNLGSTNNLNSGSPDNSSGSTPDNASGDDDY